MTHEQLRIGLQSAPFRPFKLHMADGRSFEVKHPDFLLLSPGGRTAFVFSTEEACSILDVQLMTEIEFSQSFAAR